MVLAARKQKRQESRREGFTAWRFGITARGTGLSVTARRPR
jgi:hypothetical protein